MTRLSLSIIVLIVLLASSSDGGPLAIHSNLRRIRIRSREIHPPNTPSTHAVSIWVVAAFREKVLMHWTCTPFVALSAEGEDCDASMWLRPALPGSYQIKILQAFDSTDLATNRYKAHVLAKSARPGIFFMKLIVGIDDRYCAAGKYCTTVNLTVSAL